MRSAGLSRDRLSGTANAPWYLLQLKPKGAERAETNLKRQGVEMFSPLQRITSSKGIVRLGPLFPGYLFASFNVASIPFRTINSTFGVSRLVTHGYDLEAGLSAMLINGLRARCDDEGVLYPPNNLHAKEKVRILSGPFASYVAVVEKLSAPDRVRVLFDLMGRTISAEISVSEVERAMAS